MTPDKELAFLQNMTHMALSHVEKTPNVPTPKGGMSHEKMLSFVASMAKHGLSHLDAGGTALAGPAPTQGNNNTTTGGLIGGISNVLGTNNQFQASSAPIQAGTNTNQLNNAYNSAQGALGAQSNVTNTLNTGLNTGANAQNNLSNIYAQQIQGGGPNPAQAQFAQNTASNVAQQAALQAGQRGAGSNVGLIARQIGQQGAATQQAAAGQAATQEAEQQLAAENNLQNLSSSQVAQGTGATQTLNNAQQNEQNILQGANTSANNANVSQQSNINNVNANIASGNQSTAGNVVSGVGNLLSNVPAAGSLLASIFAHGGMVRMDKGGKVLDAKARAHIAEHNFALPGGRYPIHDINHARNALARVSQNGSSAEKKKVREAVAKKYPSIHEKDMCSGGYMMAEGGQIVMPHEMPWHDAHRRIKMADGGISGQPTAGSNSYVGQWLNSNVDTQGPGMQPIANISTQGANPFKKSDKPQSATQPQAQEDPKVSGLEPFTNITDPATDNPGGGWGVSNLLAPQQGQGPLADDQSLQTGTPIQTAGDPIQSLFTNAADGGLMKTGGKVLANDPSEKAEVKGDSLKNDKIPTMLSQGEVVMDLDTLNDPGPIGEMARHVAAHIEQRNKKSGGK